MRVMWQQISSTVISEILCMFDFDGVVLDTEHGAFNDENLVSSIQVIQLKGKKCFVRVTDLDKKLVRLCLDAGVDGMIFSTVETREQADEIISYCNYPKNGGTRGQGLVRENQWGELPLTRRKPILIAQIETKLTIDNLAKIKEANFDTYLIGPYDLSASLGCVGEFENSEFLAALKRIEEVIPSSQLGTHLVKDIPNQLEKYKKYGFLALGTDAIFLIEKLKEI